MTMASPPWRMISFGALCCSCALAIGCVEDAAPARNVGTSSPSGGLAQAPPAPAPFEEAVSNPPAPGMVWVAGCWHWDGSGYTWLPGHWDSPPPP